ncbi:MAG: DnaD domain protein [Bacilli bacterium]|nr:DnaD domain protein [Bacilli bacterium]
MAQKRMFDKRVIDNDEFLEMPLTTQAIYFHLNMRADDDGFVDNWKSVLRLVGGKEDDMKVLISKKFVIPFEKGVIVIKHWKINNLLRKDRYIETIHQEEKNLLIVEKNGEYSLGIPMVDQLATQYSRVENSREKNSIVVVEDKDNLNTIEEATTPATTESLFEFVEKKFGRLLGDTEYEVISTWEDNQVTRYAIKQAELARAFNVKYIGRILESYKKENIKTVAEAEERERKFQESKTMVKNTKNYKTASERLKELREEIRQNEQRRSS